MIEGIPIGPVIAHLFNGLAPNRRVLDVATQDQLNLWEQVINILAGIVTGIVTGFGAFWAAFRRSKASIYGRIIAVEERMGQIEKSNNCQEQTLARVETCQENTTLRLTDLTRGQEAINLKIDNLGRDLLKAILEGK